MEKVDTKPKPSKFYRDPNLTFNQSVGLIILCSIITGLAVNFFNSVHYSNTLSQADGQASSAQAEVGKEQYDVKFLINNTGTKQINCYDLRSDYAREICSRHDNTQGIPQP
jgi:hypothetical protein